MPAITTRERLIDPGNPWPGLESYREEDADFFHGRIREIQALAERVDHHILTILFSASGLGKTSLLKAGLSPTLRRRGLMPIYLRLDHSDDSSSPVQQVWSGLREYLHLAPPYDDPDCGEKTMLWEWFHDTESGLLSPALRGVTPVLIFDQFEEMFTIGAGGKGSARDTESLRFLMECADLAENCPPESLVERMESDDAEGDRFDFDLASFRILITLREAYLPQLERLRSRMPSVMQNRMPLNPLSGERAMEAVTGPGGDLVNPEVAEIIVRFVGREEKLPLPDFEVEPPLLSLVCRELNRRRQDEGLETITPELIEGNQEDILERYYNDCFEGLPAKARYWVEDELLTNAGYRDSEAYETGQRRAGRESVKQLIGARLLHLDFRGRIPRIELTHDVLAKVVENSRTKRYEHEARLKAEAEQKEASAREKQAQKERRHSRFVTGIVAGLALLVIVMWLDANNQKKEAVRTKLKTVEFFRLMSGDDLVDALEDLGRLEELNVVYSKAIDQFGEGDLYLKFGLLESRGRILHAHGRHKEAHQDLQEALNIAHDLDADSAEEEVIRERYRSRARFHLAVVLRDQNRLLEAEDHFKEAIKKQHLLCDQPVTRNEAKSELADSYDELGFMLATKTNRFDEAMDALMDSLEFRTQLLGLSETKLDWRAKRARTYAYLGACLANQKGREEDAIKYYELGLEAFEDLAKNDARHGQWKTAHETAILEFGEWLREARKYEESERHFQHVIDIFGQLESLHSEDKCLMNTMAVGYLGMADLRSRRDESSLGLGAAEAEKFFKKAIVIHDTEVENNPSSIEARKGAAESHEGLATHYSRHGNYPGAATQFGEAIAHMEKLIAIDTGNQKLQNDLAFLHDGRAYAYRDQGNLEDAQKDYDEGFGIRKELVEKDPTNAEWQLDLSRSFNYLGDLARLGRKDYPAALKFFKEAMSIREELLKAAPDDPVWKARTAYCYGQMGLVNRDLEQHEESIKWHKKALGVREKLAAADPNNSTWAEDLATSHIELGEVQQRGSDFQNALTNFESAKEIRDELLKREPGNPEYEAGVAECEYHLGTITTLPREERAKHLEIAIQRIEAVWDKVRVERRKWLEDAKTLREELG